MTWVFRFTRIKDSAMFIGKSYTALVQIEEVCDMHSKRLKKWSKLKRNGTPYYQQKPGHESCLRDWDYLWEYSIHTCGVNFRVIC